MTRTTTLGLSDRPGFGHCQRISAKFMLVVWLVATCLYITMSSHLLAIELRVESNGTQTQTGELKKLDDVGVVLLVEGEERAIPLENVTRIASATVTSEASVPPPMTVTLLDGTTLGGQEVTTANSQLTLRGDATAEISVPTKSVRHVRLKAASEQFDVAWGEYLSKSYDGDVLVIRKPAGTLDFFKGIVDTISAETVTFQFDGQTIDVPRPRIEGIVFFTPGGVQKIDPLCRVTLVNGSMIPGRAVVLRDEKVIVTTASAIELAFPLTSLQAIDFSSGKIVYLSDLEPASLKVQPKIPSTLNESVVTLLYQPRRNVAIDGGPLRLIFLGDGGEEKEFSKGMAVHSRTELIWRFGGQYRKLQGWAGMDPDVQGEGQVQLVVQGDGKVLFDKLIHGSDAPLALDIDVSDVDRLTLVVDYGDQTDIGDRLNLCDLRVTK